MFITTNKRGLTLIEIMVVLLIIGLLCSIAIASFVKTRQSAQQKSCLANLRQIDSAKGTYAMEHRKTTGDPVTWEELMPNYLKSEPMCPTGRRYTLGDVGQDAACSIEGHSLR